MYRKYTYKFLFNLATTIFFFLMIKENLPEKQKKINFIENVCLGFKLYFNKEELRKKNEYLHYLKKKHNVLI